MAQTTTERDEQVDPNATQQLVTRLPDALHRQLKAMCALDGTNMQSVVTDLIQKHVSERQTA